MAKRPSQDRYGDRRDDEVEAGAVMTFGEHLEELRWRVMKAILAVAVGFGISYMFADRLFGILTAPIETVGEGKDLSMIGTGVAEAFFTKLKVSFIAGIFLASPALFYQAWRFISPGLHGHEKVYVVPFVAFGTFFFFAGVLAPLRASAASASRRIWTRLFPIRLSHCDFEPAVWSGGE